MALRTSLKSVAADFVAERVARALRKADNEAITRSEAGCARKAVNKNQRSFASAGAIRGQLCKLRHPVCKPIAIS